MDICTIQSRRNVILFWLILFPFFVIAQKDSLDQLKKYVESGDCQNALPIIHSFINKKQSLHLAWYYKAGCDLHIRDYSAALVSSNNAMKGLSATDSLYYKILGVRSLSYAFTGEIDSAIKDQELLVQHFPGDKNQVLNLSFMYGQNQQHEKSIALLQKTLKIDSTDFLIFNNLAYDYCEINEFEKAIQYAERGLQLTRDSIWTATLLNSLGYATGMSSSIDKGMALLNQSLSFYPNNPFAYINVARLYYKKKDFTKACLYAQKANDAGGVNLARSYIKMYCK